ncbi:TetR/AcrR family transcriptional regulator [Actinoallomurus bryophytorum]
MRPDPHERHQQVRAGGFDQRPACGAQVADRGFTALTVEGVAARSGVHKTTVYRRWGNVAGLIADALELAGGEPWPVPDTGTIEGDLRALARLVADGFADPREGPVSTAFVSAAMHDADAARALHAFFMARHDQSSAIVTRAVARGELSADVDPAEVVRAAVAPVYYRLFVSHEPVDAAVADRAAGGALAAARAGALNASV